ncbi:hypothetical protein NQ315_003254 [Exocentrus adspersus]|uniref:Uncharacterized protein n=1 Tax=Exocentrus adspersus TaxID=1586481 RepID=A0AAV8VD44_9CUCU|nr:hypothetical protein NQ315_003254 [Exocentrus adspersus]
MSDPETDVSTFNVQELQRRLEELGLSTDGRKAVLRERLRVALNQRGPPEDDDEVDKEENSSGASNEENDDEDEGTNEGRRNKNRYKPLLTFKDVEESMEKFSGDDHVSVKGWLNDFEEMAEMCQWADIQKIAYAKRLLTGSAKLFVKYEKCTRTWVTLRRALKDEFEEAVDGYQVHRQLAQRKKKPDETYQEYTYKMLDMASQADVDIRSVIQYIIDGIPDDPTNKAVLYGAKNIRQLKEKITQYETMKRSEARMKNKSYGNKEDKTRNDDRRKKAVDRDKKVKRCFVCGAKDHLSDECPVKDKGVKCFKCNEHGHIAAKCVSGSSRVNQPRESNSVSQPSRKKYLKEVSINNVQLTALVDTGSDLTLIRADEYVKLGSPRLIKSNVKFDGIGSSGNETIGEFVTNVTIDDVDFNMKFHVVSDTLLKYAVLIGTDFLNQVELHISAGKIAISNIVADNSNNDVPDIFQITAIEDAHTLLADLSHVKDPHDRRELEHMVTNYKPEKTREIVNDEPLLVVPKSMRDKVEHMVKNCIDCILAEKKHANARLKDDPSIREMIEEEWLKMFEEQRDEIRRDAKEKIGRIQEENLRSYNRKRKKATNYIADDLVAIKRTQLGPGLKVHSKYVGPYRIVRVLRNDRYIVVKVGEHEGPRQTSTSADYMKPWAASYRDPDLHAYSSSEKSDVPVNKEAAVSWKVTVNMECRKVGA